MKILSQGIQKLRAKTGQTDTTESITMLHLWVANITAVNIRS